MGWTSRLIGAASSGLIALCLQPARAETGAVPFQLHAEWVGRPCNDAASLKVTLTNTSHRPLAVPRRAVIPLLFIVEVADRDHVHRSLGHPYIYDIYPRNYARRGGFTVLPPGRAYAYRIWLVQEDNLGAFGRDYRRMQRNGGQVAVRYAMAYSPELAHPSAYFVTGDRWARSLRSNLLDCPATKAKADRRKPARGGMS